MDCLVMGSWGKACVVMCNQNMACDVMICYRSQNTWLMREQRLAKVKFVNQSIKGVRTCAVVPLVFQLGLMCSLRLLLQAQLIVMSHLGQHHLILLSLSNLQHKCKCL